jgi:predicted nucleic acid-binding protein
VILYVESNFVLEIALAREGENDARALLDAAEQGEIELAVPVFSICEPYGTVSYRGRKRAQDFAVLQRQLEDLGRGGANQQLVAAMTPSLADVIGVEARERAELEHTVRRLLDTATILPLTAETLDAAVAHQGTHGLDAADALIYASVLTDAAMRDVAEEKTFATRNSGDFDRAAIREELAAVGCDIVFEFAHIIGQ